MTDKVHNLKKAGDLLTPMREGKTVVFTNGCFDILHAGHLSYLKTAAQLGDILILGLNSDESVIRLKGNKRPLLPLSLRAAALEMLNFIDIIVPFDEDTPIKLINGLKPDVLVKGGDYSIEDIVGAAETINRGGEVKTIPFVHNISTSMIIDIVLKRYSEI